MSATKSGGDKASSLFSILQGLGYATLKTPQRRVSSLQILTLAQIITLIILVGGIYGYKQLNKRSSDEQSGSRAGKDSRKKGGKGNVDKEFWERIFKLVKYVIPGWKCREVKYIVTLAILLVIRTMMSIWLADVNGRVVKAIVDKDLKQFIKRVSLLEQFLSF